MDDRDELVDRLVADRYRLGRRIGLGGMAEVRAADDLRLDRPVAVKFLDPALAAQPDLRRRFEDEARAAARLNHPSVVQVFDSGEWEGRPFLVMELLSGRTLAEEMAAGPLPVERVRQMALDVLAALGAAHEAGVLHRDVKPANLLVAADGSIKIGDFGIAKADPVSGERSPGETAPLSPPTMTGQIFGTPSYLAPERVAGKPATPASDVWALGVVCWEALAGRRAYPPGQGVQTALAVVSTDLAPVAVIRPDADPALAHAVDMAVARDPADRWPSAQLMADALAGARPESPGDATVVLNPGWASAPAAFTVASPARSVPIGPPRSTAVRWAPPKRTGTYALVALGVAAAIIGAVALLGGGHASHSTPPAPVRPVASTSTSGRATTTTSTSTSTTTTTTSAPVSPGRGKGKKGG
ncbi:MAG: hypothetical protein NVS3B21_06890 [Acidimicrobiales bacterium]